MGLLLAMPFGPVNLLGIQRAVERGFFGGVSSFVEVESYVDVFTMVAAIMGGSFLYWFVVSQFIATIRHRLDVVRLGQINRIAGLVLIGFGCVLIGEMVLKRPRFW